MDVLEAVKREMFRRKLSLRTMETYLFYIRKFLVFCKKDPRQFSKKDCREFLDRFVERDAAGSTLNVALNSLRFMMEEVLRKSMRLNMKYSKTPKKLPEWLSREEVKRLVNAIENKKHRLLASLMYGSGLRVSEAVKLKLCDIDIESEVGWVRHGKGDKDRPFILPKCLIADMKEAISKGQFYLFPGREGGHLSPRSAEEIVKKAAFNAGIKKSVHPHTLRHSFATHILEDGHDVIAVQSLLGHNEARTTMEYLHSIKPKLLSVKSPLDSL